MKRLLFTMFLVVACVMAVFAFSFESPKQATCGPGDQISVLQLSSDYQQTSVVQAIERFDSVLQLSKTEKATRHTEVRRTFAPTVQAFDEAPDIYEHHLAGVKEKPKENTYNGLGHDHFARADV